MTPAMTSDFFFLSLVPLFFVYFGVEWALKLYIRHSNDLEA